MSDTDPKTLKELQAAIFDTKALLPIERLSLQQITTDAQGEEVALQRRMNELLVEADIFDECRGIDMARVQLKKDHDAARVVQEKKILDLQLLLKTHEAQASGLLTLNQEFGIPDQVGDSGTNGDGGDGGTVPEAVGDTKIEGDATP